MQTIFVVGQKGQTMKVIEERIANKYRFFIGEESTIDGVKRIVHMSGYFKSRKDAEKRLREMERKV